jgi:uncharacterized membrane protein
MIEFGQPLTLLLLPPLLGWTLWRALRLEAIETTRRRLVAATRCLLFTLIILVLAEIRLTDVDDHLTVFFALDWSDSIPDDQRQLALEFIRESAGHMRPDDRSGLIIFGRDPSIESAPAIEPELPEEVTAVESDVNAGRTNIAGALRLALAALPDAARRRVVLLTDGNENFGEAHESARLAQDSGVPIDVFPLRYLHENDIRLSRVDVPPRVHLDAPFDVRIFVDADRDTEGLLRLYEDGRPIREDRVRLRGDIRNVFSVPRTLVEARFHTYSAEIEVPGDSNPNNNTGEAFTHARGEPRVLLVDSEEDLGRDLVMALRREEIDVDYVGTDHVPSTLAQIQTYDSVIFSNVGADRISRDQMEMIERAVEDLGIGFIMIGGPNSFGPGGYQDTPIERLLPVLMEISHRRVLPNGALAIILHTVEIPDGNAWAREVTLAALDVLSSRDHFGVLYYGTPVGADPGQRSQFGFNWMGTSGMEPVGDKGPWRRLIANVQPSDMPDFDQTLMMANASLQQTNAALKHIVIISDGDPSPPKPALTQSIYDAGISISTIVIAPHHPQNAQLMQQIAHRHGGNFYYPTSPSQLPQIFIREATVVRRSMIDEDTFRPEMVRPSEAMPGFELGPMEPVLLGHVVTEPEPTADVPITVPEGNDPVLAHWRYGLGHTAAFTSDAKARWGSQWLTWDEYSRFWAQLVRWSLRDSADRNFRITTQVTGAEGLITIDAIGDDEQFINFADFEGRLIPPSYDPDAVRRIAFRQTAPGRYEGRFDVEEIGSHMISIATDAGGESQLLTTGLSISYSPEFQTSEVNTGLLGNLAETTGGRMNVSPRQVFDHDLPAGESLTPMWQPTLAAAAIVLPFDIFFRRVLISWADFAAALGWLMSWIGGNLIPRRRRAERDATTAALLDVKDRVAEEREGAATAEDKRRLQEALARVKAERGITSEIKTAPERPRVTPRAAGGGEAKPVVKPESPEYTSALLRAKKRAKKKM